MKFPFTQIPNDVIRSKFLNTQDKAILFCIASFHPAFPSYKSISEMTGCTYRTVSKTLSKLERIGALVIKRIDRKNNSYDVRWAILCGRG